MRVTNELKIGMTVVIAVIIGFIGFRIMKDVPLLRQGDVIFTVYDRVDGLSVGTPVTLRGIKIGSVQRLTLLPSDSVLVALNINTLDGLPMGSKAYIKSVDLLGTKGVEVVRGPGPGLIQHGDFMTGIFDEGLMGQLAARGSDISNNVNQSTERINILLSELQSIMQEGGKEDINKTLNNLNSTTSQIDALLNETNDDLKKSISSLRRSIENVETLTADEEGNIKNMLANLEASSAEIEGISTNLKVITTDLSDILRKINQGEGTLGLMVNDPNLYHNLDTLAINLNVFLEQMNENPRHYLRHLRLIRIF